VDKNNNESEAARMFESMWPGVSWSEASAEDKKMFRDHAESVASFFGWRAATSVE